MPEAAINEHGNLPTGEDDVGANGAPLKHYPEVAAIAKSSCMEEGADRELRFRVPAADRLHVSSSAQGRRFGCFLFVC